MLLLAAALAAPLPLPDRFEFPAEELSTVPRVVLVPEPGAGIVTAQWLFNEGASADPAAAFGRAHLLEHLSFGQLGTGVNDDYDTRLGQLGGLSEGWTDRERSGLGATVPVLRSDSGLTLLRLELDRAEALVISDEAAGRQRVVIEQELAEANDSAHGPDRVWLSTLLWAFGQPWASHPQGQPFETSGLGTLADRWRQLVAGAVLVIAGEFDAVPLRSEAQGRLPAATPIEGTLPPALGEPGCEPAAPATVWRRGNGNRGTVYVAWPVPGRGHRDRIALEALARWAGGARVSLGAGCGEWVAERTGTWWELARHRDSLLGSIGAVGERGLDATTVDRLRAEAVADHARALGSLPLRARLVAGCVLVGRRPDCVRDEVEAWLGLTGKEVAAAAARWLPPGAATTLVVVRPDTRFAPLIPEIRPWAAP